MVIPSSALTRVRIDASAVNAPVEKMTLGDFVAGVFLGSVLFVACALIAHNVFGLPVNFLGLA
jgi:hypothetical protein